MASVPSWIVWTAVIALVDVALIAYVWWLDRSKGTHMTKALEMALYVAQPHINEVIVFSDARLAQLATESHRELGPDIHEHLKLMLRLVRDASNTIEYKPWRYSAGLLVDALLYTDAEDVTEAMMTVFHSWVRKLRVGGFVPKLLELEDISPLKAHLIRSGWKFTARSVPLDFDALSN